MTSFERAPLPQKRIIFFVQFGAVTYFWHIILEVVSKPQIMFESKASHELKTERARQYVSISISGTTLLSDIRWGFENTSSIEYRQS
jgi:hypothetical protein